MEDIGDILFYVIAAVIGIAGAISNKKKKKAEQERAAQAEEEMPEIEEEDSFYSDEMARGAETQYEMIGEDDLQTSGSGLDDTIDETPGWEAVQKKPGKESLQEEPMADEFEHDGASVTDFSITSTELGTDSEIPLEEDRSWASSLADEFDLPKAIVYSEILKRKDFV
ncbi:MAG TPA: hypothetical protein VJ877_00410 [Bacteroidales bacterium]|nr:hypothetical protein [Bacteroidales bacterium]